MLRDQVRKALNLEKPELINEDGMDHTSPTELFKIRANMVQNTQMKRLNLLTQKTNQLAEASKAARQTKKMNFQLQNVDEIMEKPVMMKRTAFGMPAQNTSMIANYFKDNK